MSVQSSAHPVASVIGVVVHDANVLLVRRINPPDAGKWGRPMPRGRSGGEPSVRFWISQSEKLSLTWPRTHNGRPQHRLR